MRILIGLLAVPLLLGLSGPAGAEEEARPARRQRAFWRSERTVERLGLTPDQVERLEAVETELAERQRELTESWREARGAIREELAKAEFSPERARELGKKIAELAGERSELNTERQIETRRVLTADQWAELQAVRERMEERMEERREGMRQRMRGGPRGEAAKRGWLIDPDALED